MSVASDPLWGDLKLTKAQKASLREQGVAIEVPVEDRAQTTLPVVWFDQIEPVCDVKDFVQGLLIEQAAVVVYGASNAGKTFWTTDLALHVAAGIPWHGRRVETGGVIYCVLEGGMGFRNRVAAWRRAHGLEDQFIPFAAIPSQIDLLDIDGAVDNLVSAIKAASDKIRLPVKLVVIDTLSRALAGGNENAPEDMGALVRNMDFIRQETGSAVLFVHHSGKDAAKGARGHSLLRAAIDTEIEVVAEQGSEAKTATVVKQRELKNGDVFGFNLAVVDIGRNRHGESVTTCVVVHSEDPGCQASARVAHPRGAAKRAMDVLMNVLAQHGKSGYPETPSNVLSVSEKAWRDRFYEEAMPGAEYETKKKGFRRAADSLIEARHVAMAGYRVWIVNSEQYHNSNNPFGDGSE